MRGRAAQRTMTARRTSGCRAISIRRSPAWRPSGEESWCLPMRRNLVLVRLGSTEPLRPQGMDRANLAFLENKNLTPPVDLMIGKAGKPDPEGDQVAQWNERQMLEDGAVLHYADANLERDRSAKESRRGQGCPRPPA